MPEAFKLAPAAADQTVTVTIPKELKPYVDQWYADRIVGLDPVPTLEAFLLTMLKGAVTSHRFQKLDSDIRQSHIDGEKTDHETLSSEYATETAAL